MNRTTKEWNFPVKWKDGQTSWTPLKDLKEGETVSTEEYSVATQIYEEPDFAWQVPDTLRRAIGLYIK